MWKWEHVPWTWANWDTIWVIMDRLTKCAHFLPTKTTDSTSKLIQLYVEEMVWLHDIPTSMVVERNLHFTSISGIIFKKPLSLPCILVLFVILKLTDRLNEFFRHWRTCYMPVYWSLVIVGTNISPSVSLSIIIFITSISIWLYLKLSMVGLVKAQLVKMRLGIGVIP